MENVENDDRSVSTQNHGPMDGAGVDVIRKLSRPTQRWKVVCIVASLRANMGCIGWQDVHLMGKYTSPQFVGLRGMVMRGSSGVRV